ncbi:MAG: GntR family transcriptional regulator [Bryobacteraceae bacterium]
MSNVLVREPMYQQLYNHLRTLIRSGEFPVGGKFLTERQIAERFGVSRVTANKALSSLVSEGLLEFRKGVGTLVRAKALDYNLRYLVSFTEEAIAAGKRPRTQVLHFETVEAKDVLDEVPALLKAEPESKLYYVERLRLADNLPVIYERRYIVAEYCPELNRSDLERSLYALWTEKYRLEIEGADERIRAVHLRGPEARILRVRDGAAGLLIRSVGYLRGGRPLWFERTLYRGDAYEFHNRLGGIQPASFPQGRFLDAVEVQL